MCHPCGDVASTDHDNESLLATKEHLEARQRAASATTLGKVTPLMVQRQEHVRGLQCRDTGEITIERDVMIPRERRS